MVHIPVNFLSYRTIFEKYNVAEVFATGDLIPVLALSIVKTPYKQMKVHIKCISADIIMICCCQLQVKVNARSTS